MANQCTNKFQLITPHIDILNKVKNYVEEISGEITYECYTNGKILIEGTFESNWVFPFKDFSEILIDGETDHTWFKCLSEEPGNDYIAMNIFTPSQWWDEQTFDMPTAYDD